MPSFSLCSWSFDLLTPFPSTSEFYQSIHYHLPETWKTHLISRFVPTILPFLLHLQTLQAHSFQPRLYICLLCILKIVSSFIKMAFGLINHFSTKLFFCFNLSMDFNRKYLQIVSKRTSLNLIEFGLTYVFSVEGKRKPLISWACS